MTAAFSAGAVSIPDRDASSLPGGPALDVQALRAQFPILSQSVHGKTLVYLDNAATSQKPLAVLDAVAAYYRRDNANVHRGVHTLSERATVAFEEARSEVARFLGARDVSEIVFTRGATEALNLVASSYGGMVLKAGDEVLVTEMEHHSNIVPWQMACARSGARLVVAPIDDRGELRVDEFEKLLTPRTRIVALAHVSNALGTVNPVARLIASAHTVGAKVVVDGAQAVPHTAVDVAALDCDFYVFSGHKVYAPMGSGALYARRELLDAMPPWQGGGDMILSVTFDETTYNVPPYKFEAGTPDVGAAVGLGAALRWLTGIGIDKVAAYEHDLLAYAESALLGVPNLRLIGTARDKAGAHSFLLGDIHPHDVGTILDNEGIAVRTGHHCAQPVMQHFGIPATARASFAVYNTRDDVDRLVTGLLKVQEMFG